MAHPAFALLAAAAVVTLGIQAASAPAYADPDTNKAISDRASGRTSSGGPTPSRDSDIKAYTRTIERAQADGVLTAAEQRNIKAIAQDLARQYGADAVSQASHGTRDNSLADVPNGPAAAGMRSGQGFGASFGGAPCCKSLDAAR